MSSTVLELVSHVTVHLEPFLMRKNRLFFKGKEELLQNKVAKDHYGLELLSFEIINNNHNDIRSYKDSKIEIYSYPAKLIADLKLKYWGSLDPDVLSNFESICANNMKTSFMSSYTPRAVDHVYDLCSIFEKYRPELKLGEIKIQKHQPQSNSSNDYIISIGMKVVSLFHDGQVKSIEHKVNERTLGIEGKV